MDTLPDASDIPLQEGPRCFVPGCGDLAVADTKPYPMCASCVRKSKSRGLSLDAEVNTSWQPKKLGRPPRVLFPPRIELPKHGETEEELRAPEPRPIIDIVFGRHDEPPEEPEDPNIMKRRCHNVVHCGNFATVNMKSHAPSCEPCARKVRLVRYQYASGGISGVKCAEKGCDKKRYRRGLCNAHDLQRRRLEKEALALGIDLPHLKKVPQTCRYVGGCTEQAAYKKLPLCKKHYDKVRNKLKNPLAAAKKISESLVHF